MPLNISKNEPFSSERREHFEELRKNHVPRFLFRAWFHESGGGPKISTNNETEIVPPAFRKLDQSSESPKMSSSFYSMDESYIYEMAYGHYRGSHEPLTGFSSWAASIHLVLCNAAYIKNDLAETDVHVAVMDTYQLDDDVHVWHVPHLIDFGDGGSNGNHEYLAYGPIRGKGYKAVPLEELVQLADLVPDIRNGSNFGYRRRAALFRAGPKDVKEPKFLDSVKMTASLFGHLSLPVAIALINFHRRPWMREDPIRRDPTEEEVDVVLEALGNPEIPSDWVDMAWLQKPDMVDTKTFPDVQQYIDFLRSLLRQKVAKPQNMKVEEDEDSIKLEGTKANVSPGSVPDAQANNKQLCSELAEIEL